MIKAFKTAVLLLIVTALFTRCIQGDEEALNGLKIKSMGECTLPNIVAQNSIYQSEKYGNEVCIIYAAPGNYRHIGANDCIVSTYNLHGNLTEHAFVVGERWHIFPIIREDKACSAVISMVEWNILRNLPDISNKMNILNTKTTVDSSTKNEENYRVLININDTHEESLNSFLNDAIDEAILIRDHYKRRTDVSIDAFTHERRLKEGGEPICSGKTSRSDGDRKKISCDRTKIDILNSSTKILFNLTPEKRREVFNRLAESSKAYTKKHYQSPDPVDAKNHLISLNAISARIDKSIIDHTMKEYKIDRDSINYILNEGHELGWAYPLADSIHVRVR